jgi:restriction system protein
VHKEIVRGNMSRRRGFFAELHHQSVLAEKRKAQLQLAAERAHKRAAAEVSRAHREVERSMAMDARAAESDRKKAESERKAADAKAHRLYCEDRDSEVSAMNEELALVLENLDSILKSTLVVDDFVDLNALRMVAKHAPFVVPHELAVPVPEVLAPVLPPAPVFVEPPAPGALAGLVGGKKRREAEVVAAHVAHDSAVAAWADWVGRTETWLTVERNKREAAERERIVRVEALRSAYDADHQKREEVVKEQNVRLDKLISELAFDVPSAILEYVGIVLSNSVYPEEFQVEHDYEFALASRELTLKILAPPPSVIPTVKEYKYLVARDEITSVASPLRDLKYRYESAISQTAIRSLHEVFEADRAAKIQLMSLTVAVLTIDPGTGLPSVVPLVAVAVDRSTFSSFDLTNVVPLATLQHLGAVVSKSCFDLVPVDITKSIRRR